MQFRKSQGGRQPQRTALPPARRARLRSIRNLAGIAAGAVAIAVIAGAQNPAAQPQQQPAKTTFPSPDANRFPDANEQAEMRDQQGKQQSYSAANIERRKQIADDSARLLKLATDLKTEVDKTTKDTLSLGVIRKADEIEKLAHNVKEKMKLTVGAS